MEENKIWDSKRGWIKIIKMKRPSLDYFNECVERYDNADWNPSWHTNPSKLPAKIGIKKKDEPVNVFLDWDRKNTIFEWKDRIMKVITFFSPNTKIEVIE